MRVLVVDDDEVTAAVLEHSLIEFGYDVTVARNGREAFELLRSGEIRMVVSDWCMPEMTGLELCRRIRQRRSGTYVYIIMLTSNSSTKDVVEGLNAGADDYITKPFQPEELQVRLRVGERVLSLESRDLTIFALAKLAESRDPDTGAHLERIREYCRVMAEELVRSRSTLEDVDGDFVHMIYLTSPLHDIGKVGIPDHVLLKPGPLDRRRDGDHEAAHGDRRRDARHARQHALRSPLPADGPGHRLERTTNATTAAAIRAVCPGGNIPLCGRIVAVADVYDALTSKRVYKEAYSHEMAKSMICDGRGTHFDPIVVDAFLRREQDFLRLKEALAEPHDMAELTR